MKLWHLLALGGGLLVVCRRPRPVAVSGPSIIGQSASERRAAVQRIARGLGQAAQKAPAAAVRTKTPARPPSPPLFVFVHDRALIPIAMNAVRRLEAATGIKVTVNARGTIKTAAPIYGSDFLCANGTDGRAFQGGIALARDCKIDPEKVMLHELIHALGVGHLKLPQRGLMNEAEDAPLDGLSAYDLKALCAVRTDCTRFVPEV